VSIENAEDAVDRAILLLQRPWVAIGSLGLDFGLYLGDDIGLVDSALDDLLLLRGQILSEVLVERRLFLLET
jgi:hypothetical protein